MSRRSATLVALTALAVLAGSCRDEDVADDPVLPSNVNATVQRCGIVDGAPVAVVEVTNGTGHTARFGVAVDFVQDGRTEGSAVGSSDDIQPGATGLVRVVGEADVGDVRDCRIEDVTDLSS